MTALKAMQADFLGHVLEEGRDCPEGWTARHEAGMAIYRGGYRARLIDTIGETYERTRRLVGEDAFRQAAINHVIAHPPTGWSIDEVGSGFADSLAELNPERPACAELARIEEAMQAVSSVADAEPLTAQDFAGATRGLGDTDWAKLRLRFMPGLALVPIAHAWMPIWHLLGEDGEQPDPQSSGDLQYAAIWREGEQPVFVTLTEENGALLSAMLYDAAFEDGVQLLAERTRLDTAAEDAGAMIGQWLNLGLVLGVQ